MTFNNFSTNLSAATAVAVAVSGGSFAGFTFSPQGGSNTSYFISYTATCNASCLITGASDSTSEIPAGGSIYSFVVGPASSGNISGNFSPSFAGLASGLALRGHY